MTPGIRLIQLARALAATALLVLASTVAFASDIAVVVHPDVQLENLTFAELRRVLLGDREFWPSGQPVTLIVRAPIAAERTVLLKKVYGMTEPQFRQYWIGKVFRAEAASGPRIVVSNNESVEMVGVLPGAIALVDADDIPSGLKILKIDGRRPGDKDYALKKLGAAPTGK